MNVALCFLIRDDKVLLAMTNDRPNQVTWNGLAAITDGLNNEQKLLKEIYRLTKLTIYENALTQIGVVHYFTIDDDHNRTETMTATLYLCETWQGEATNATGTRPTWFDYDQIPFADMFEDMAAWLPKILDGNKIIVEVYLRIDPKTYHETIQDILIRDII